MPDKEKSPGRVAHGKKFNYRHGLSRHPLYQKWKDARRRCAERKEYIEAGITMQVDWLDDPTSFICYLEGFLPPRQPGQSLDRIDPNRGYEEGNLRWASPRVQRLNQRRMQDTAQGLQQSPPAGYSWSEVGCLCPIEEQRVCPCSPGYRWGDHKFDPSTLPPKAGAKFDPSTLRPNADAEFDDKCLEPFIRDEAIRATAQALEESERGEPARLERAIQMLAMQIKFGDFFGDA